jgi:3-deoxy-D-manno-octulosonic-acid transferase
MRTLIVNFYSLIIAVIYTIAKILKVFNSDLAYQLKDRQHPRMIAQFLAEKRSQKRESFLFFCSSAGEYEQAKPIIKRLKCAGDPYILIVFHSQSGFDFAKIRGEESDFCLAPPDTLWHWGWLLSAITPDRIFVIRYELWPAFLEASSKFGELILINGNVPDDVEPSFVKRAIRKQLLHYFSKIYVVNNRDRNYFAGDFSIDQKIIVPVGDTKYDQVMEAMEQNKNLPRSSIIEKIASVAGDRGIFVLGSCYEPDVDLFLKACSIDGSLPSEWLVVFVPHDISSKTTDGMAEKINSCGSNYKFIDDANEAESADIIILNKMGMLTQLFEISNLAWIGGALHNRVHNVLEPACYGLPIAFGPRFKTSHEAIYLAENNLALVIEDADAFTQWWKKNTPEDKIKRQKMLDSMSQLTGAADSILKDLKS